MMTQSTNLLPLIERELTDIIVRDGTRTITCARFLQDVARVVAQLKATMADKQYAVNLCTDRYAFLVSFAAVMCRGQTNLLPPNQVKNEVQAIADAYAGSYFIVSEAMDGFSQDQFKVTIDSEAPSVPPLHRIQIPNINYTHVAAIVFTSGSTGSPTPHLKRWGDIIRCAKLSAERFDLNKNYQLISTVPSQHMYGLETSVLHPFIAQVTLYNSMPFYPEDIRRAVSAADTAVELVSTPIHLRACVKSNLPWQNIKLILSAATALPQELAIEVVETMHAPVFEIYGCTEAGSMATRETVREQTWLPYAGSKFYQQNDSFFLKASYLPEAVELADKIKLHDNGRIELQGRNTDLVKIAGKRGHIGDLNNKLAQIKGVQAGAFYQPDAGNDDQRVNRLTAFVVAPDREPAEILAELGTLIDPVFIPRPLYKVSALPFTSTGKLPRSVLHDLYNSLQNDNACH